MIRYRSPDEGHRITLGAYACKHSTVPKVTQEDITCTTG